MSEQENSIQNEEFEEPVVAQVDDSADDLVEDPKDTPEDNTVTFKRSHLYTVLLPLAFVAGLTFGYIFWGRDVSPGVSQPAVAAVPGDDQEQAQSQPGVPAQPGEPAAPPGADPTPEFRRYDIPEDDDPVLGPDDAPITIIEFSDYECPYCRKWHVEVWPQLEAEYGDQIRLVYRDFPLTSIHSNASPAAVAANCAGEQDMYWAYSKKLFDMKLNLGKSTYQSYAKELGLDMDTFNECMESGRYVDEVEADYQFAATLGIRSTPTFFVNGIPVVGAQPFEVFKNLIDKELAGELPQ